MEENRIITVHLTRVYKNVINKNKKKCKSDYVLNVDRIIKLKICKDFVVMNRIQAFMLNYEINKLLNKVITIDNCKYTDIIYINENMSVSSVLNLINLLDKTYKNVTFEYQIYHDDDDINMVDSLSNHKPNIIKKAVN
jgi:hypothetical protein